MRTIETNVIITSEGHLSGQVPTDISPGEHRAVLVIDEEPISRREHTPFEGASFYKAAAADAALEFNPYQLGLVSDSMTFRREDIYDDSGR